MATEIVLNWITQDMKLSKVDFKYLKYLGGKIF